MFVLTTVASNAALGAVLSQNGHPIAYSSRTLNRHECNYSTIEKELLAIVWATTYFRPYLYGRKFTIQTDHRPLVWLNSLKEPNIKLQRWKIKLNEFDFNIEYIKGKTNHVSDSLSRLDIYKFEDSNDINDIPSDLATIHSGIEDLNDHIHLSELPLNIFKNQIIIELGDKYKCTKDTIYGNKIRYTLMAKEFKEESVLPMLRDILPIKGKVGLFCENFKIYKLLQKIIVKYFSRGNNMTILKCSKFLKDIFEKDVLYEVFEEHHKEKNHRGIRKPIMI